LQGHVPGLVASYFWHPGLLVQKKPPALFILQVAHFEVIPTGFEPVTHSLEGCCSIQLSYGTVILRKFIKKNQFPFTYLCREQNQT
jgi:hypothetical protein